jgi:hypothetical protein
MRKSPYSLDRYLVKFLVYPKKEPVLYDWELQDMTKAQKVMMHLIEIVAIQLKKRIIFRK